MNLLSWHCLIATHPLYRNVIAWVSSYLIQKSDWLAVQSHMFSPETQITNFSHIILAIAMIVFEEQVYRSCRIPQCSVQRNLGNLIATRKVNCLGGWKISCCPEVEVVTISEEFELAWSRTRI